MITSFLIHDMHFFPGAVLQLGDKTAVVDLRFEGEIPEIGNFSPLLRELVTQLRPSEPLFGIDAVDWPGKFVQNGAGTSAFAAWIVALSVAIQRWARDPVWIGRVIKQQDGQVQLALPYQRKDVCRQAVQIAVRILMHWQKANFSAQQTAKLNRSLDDWLTGVVSGGLSPNSLRFALAAQQRQLPIKLESGMIFVGWGVHRRMINSSFTDRSGVIPARVARNKASTNQLLKRYQLPVPDSCPVRSWDAAERCAQNFGWPLVVKPISLDKGTGVVVGIRDLDQLRQAYSAAIKLCSDGVLIEKFVAGDDHRLLVLDGNLHMAVRRLPGAVVGDGIKSVAELIDQLNQHPLRGRDNRNLMIVIDLDEMALQCLAEQNLSADAIPEAGQCVRLRRTANISTGGTAENVELTEIHPDNRIAAERAARLIGLDIAGVDFLTPDITRSWRENGGVINEVNGQPAFRPLWLGDLDRDINGEVIDWMFKNHPSRIPTAAINCGDRGNSSLSLILLHIWETAGKIAGASSSSGVWIGPDMISADNSSEFYGASLLLNDPIVEAAIFNLSTSCLMTFGHPCDCYSVGAVLKRGQSPQGKTGALGQRVFLTQKTELLLRCADAVVVDAEDDDCLTLMKIAGSRRLILTSECADHAVLSQHRQRGGEAVMLDHRQETLWILVVKGSRCQPIVALQDIGRGRDSKQVNNTDLLFAVALSWSQGFSADMIRKGLTTLEKMPQVSDAEPKA